MFSPCWSNLYWSFACVCVVVVVVVVDFVHNFIFF